jgi:hypothetical protein
MTFSDRDRAKVDLASRPTTIANISALKPPVRIVPRRTTGFQRHVWQLQTVLDRYRIASNGEIVLILFSIQSSQYMNAYMPNPACLSRLTRNLIGATIDISGIGFWNPVKTTRGALPNGAELRPVTSFRIVAGCGVGG